MGKPGRRLDQFEKPAFRPNRCGRCYGRGIIKDKATKRYIRCHCPKGQTLDSDGMNKLNKQYLLDKRLEELRTKGW